MPEEIRLIAEEEMDQLFNSVAQAFQIPAERVMDYRGRQLPGARRGLFVDGSLRVSLLVLPLQVWFGGRPVSTGGVSGVVTPPEWRRQGYIGRLLRASVEAMLEEGQVLSTLYPFSFPFYKHYGWEHASDNLVYTIPTERLPVVPPSGSWHPVQVATDVYPPPDPDRIPAEEVAVLSAIYDAWAVRYNGMMAREIDWWRAHKLDKRRNVFYWRDPAGVPRAYLTYSFKELAPWERRMETTFVALDPAALRAVLGFLRNHDSQAKEVALTLPPDMNLHALLDDPRFAMELEPGYMLRINDVAAALSARGYNAAAPAGRVTMRVAGVWPQQETATYTLEVDGGVGRAVADGREPDLSLDQRVLAQLYCGYLTPYQAADLGLLDVHDQSALVRLAGFFAGRGSHLADFF